MVKAKHEKINDTAENWESRKLGADEEFVQTVSVEEEAALDAALSMKPISIRLPENLLLMLKLIAKHHNVGYQPLIRDVLTRFSKAEIRVILRELEASADEGLDGSPAEGYFDEDQESLNAA